MVILHADLQETILNMFVEGAYQTAIVCLISCWNNHSRSTVTEKVERLRANQRKIARVT